MELRIVAKNFALNNSKKFKMKLQFFLPLDWSENLTPNNAHVLVNGPNNLIFHNSNHKMNQNLCNLV